MKSTAAAAVAPKAMKATKAMKSTARQPAFAGAQRLRKMAEATETKTNCGTKNETDRELEVPAIQF